MVYAGPALPMTTGMGLNDGWHKKDHMVTIPHYQLRQDYNPFYLRLSDFHVLLFVLMFGED